MATDGDIDFRKYTREQLDKVVGRIDRVRYPINYRNLVSEYERRRSEAAKGAKSSVPAADATEFSGIEFYCEPDFTIEFQPHSGPSTWLGPSRNDFHLVGSGTLRIVDHYVRLTGRRFGILLGLPLNRQVMLPLDGIVNVESDGPAVRFELRPHGEKTRGVTLWLSNPPDANRLCKALPIERTTDFSPQLPAHLEFERCLIAQSPNTPVTYGFVAINVLVYVATAFVTRDWLAFGGSSLVRLGSNFGPYTADGDWWRMLTAIFLHAGLLHLVFNMWALVSFGPIVERLYGSVPYLMIYLVAGLAGSLASITWHPDVNSVGASGAIFGVLGALIAAQVRKEASIPRGLLRPLRNTSVIYTVCALAAGLSATGVDNAAHIGGISAGFLCGLAVSRPVTGKRLGTLQNVWRGARAVALAAFIIAAGGWSAQSASARLTGEPLFEKTLHWFVPGQIAALGRWQTLGRTAKAHKWDGETFARALEREVLPFWKDADARWAKVGLNSTSPDYANLQYMKTITSGRLHAYQLTATSLRLNDDKMADSANQEQQRMDKIIHNHNENHQ